MNRLRALVVGFATALIAIIGLATPADADPGEVSLYLTGLEPAVVRPSDTLELTGTVTNETDEVFTDVTVEIAVQWAVPRTEETLLSWFDAEDAPGARLEYRSEHSLTVAAGDSGEFNLNVPMSEITFPIRFDNWGARGLEITLTDGTDSATARTMGVFYPEDDLEEEPLQVAALAAATPTASEWEDVLANPSVVDTELAERIRGITSIPDLSIALDPAVMSASVATSVIELPWADADIGILPLAGPDGHLMLDQAQARSANTLAQSELQVAEDIAWPASSGITADLVGDLVADGYRAIVLPADALDVAETGGTPNARRTLQIDTANTASSLQQNHPDSQVDDVVTIDAVVADAEFSSAVAGTVAGRDVDTDLAARQQALALSAVAAREADPPTSLLAVIDRTTTGQLESTDITALTERMAALGQAPWLDVVDVPTMLETEATTTANASDLTGTDALNDEDRAVISEAVRLADRITGLTSSFTEEAGLAQLAETLPVAPSTAWRISGRTGSQVTDAVSARITELTTGVTVAPPESNVNLFAEESAIPIVVTNALDVPVTVHIKVTPELPALQIEGVPNVTLEANSAQTVRVPVTAVANGTTEVIVDVVSPDGEPLGPSAPFHMSVQAEWETVTTGVLAGLLLLLLVLGLVRNIRRGRRGDDGRPATPLVRGDQGMEATS